MNWRDAFEERVVLWRFWHTSLGKATAYNFANDVMSKGAEESEGAFFAQMASIEKVKLANASPIFVDADMVDLVQTAAESFEPEPLEYEDLLAPVGFALLEKPLVMKDVHGEDMSWRAISWAPTWDTPTGILMPGEDADAETTKELFQAPPRGVTITMYSGRGDPDGYAFDELTEGTPMSRYFLSVVHMTNLPFGDEPSVMGMPDRNDAAAIDEEQARRGHYFGWSLLQVLWRLMLQRITTTETRHVDRKARRRAKHEGLKEEDAVTVVTLRRLRQQGEADEQHVEWSHRWIVSGHWRRQWYPTLNRHRRVWISPYVKGPEDAELRVKERVYQLVR